MTETLAQCVKQNISEIVKDLNAYLESNPVAYIPNHH